MDFPQRKQYRLKDYDYSQNGAYFVTICTKDRQPCLWNVGATCGRPNLFNRHLSNYGLCIDKEINRINQIYEMTVVVDKYVIMPNHLHMIINLQNQTDGRPKVAPTISRIVQQFKGSVSKQLGFSIWQKLYYDHVIRNEEVYQHIWEYIDENPYKWEDDSLYMK